MYLQIYNFYLMLLLIILCSKICCRQAQYMQIYNNISIFSDHDQATKLIGLKNIQQSSERPTKIHKVTFDTCGENLTYSVDNDTLTISGIGEMFFDTIPWWSIRYNIKFIIIEEGVTSIYSHAFDDF